MKEKERILIEISPEEKKLIHEEALYQKKTMKALILDAVIKSRRLRLDTRTRIPDFEVVLDEAQREWVERGDVEGEKMQKLTRIFAGVAEKITVVKAWKWSKTNLEAWEMFVTGTVSPEGGRAVFSLDGEPWTVENVTKKYGLAISKPSSTGAKLYYIANDYLGQWDVEAMIREMIAKGAK